LIPVSRVGVSVLSTPSRLLCLLDYVLIFKFQHPFGWDKEKSIPAGKKLESKPEFDFVSILALETNCLTTYSERIGCFIKLPLRA